MSTSGNKRQRIRSGVPGNLPAAGAAPRLCPHGKQEEDGKGEWRRKRGQGGRDGGREGGTHRVVGKGLLKNNTCLVQSYTMYLVNSRQN